jgi:hypothetical protein
LASAAAITFSDRATPIKQADATVIATVIFRIIDLAR